MIVKNEEHVLDACLASVRPHIDHWVIVDTGSTDNTEMVAKHALAGIPGTFDRIEWPGFGPARTHALRLAEGKADYAFVLDADETIDAPNGLGALGGAAYVVWHRPNDSTQFLTRRLFNMKSRWSYHGVLHEYPMADKPWEDEMLDSVSIRTTQNGARSLSADKYRDDAMALERALVNEPDNSRYVFYLAQSWRGAGEDARAAARYMQRTTMGVGLNPEETFIAYLEAGRAFGRLGRVEECEAALLRARQVCPTRPESMASLADLYRALAESTPPNGTMNVETCHYKPGPS
jgi:glycosyltransferase involved in cell wall biosynthesis